MTSKSVSSSGVTKGGRGSCPGRRKP